MLTETQIRKIRKLRDECYTWEEIAEITQLPKTVCFYAMRRRKGKNACRRNARVKKQAELIRTLRHTIRHLETKLFQREVEA